MSASTQVAPTLSFSAAELVSLRFRLLARRRAAWLRSLDVPGRASEADLILDDVDTPDAEMAWTKAQPWAAQWEEELHGVEAALLGDQSSFLARLRALFGLNAEETDLLEACAAVALDPSLGRLCAYLQNRAARGYITEEMVARVYGYGRCGVWNPDSALFSWELIQSHEFGPGEPHALFLDPQLRDRLCGRHTLPGALAGAARWYESVETVGSLPVEETATLIEQYVNAKSVSGLRLVIEGGRGSGRRTLAGAVSARLRLNLLLINSDEISDQNWRRSYMLAQRHAYFDNTAIAWYGESLSHRPWLAGLPSFPVQFAIVETGGSLLPLEGVSEHRVRVPALTVADRSTLWRTHLPSSRDWPPHEFDILAERYRVQPGDIVAASVAAVKTPLQAALRVREASRSRLGGLAQLLRCSFTWNDLVVPAALREALEDIVFEANHRALVWEDPEAHRLFPQGQGLIALLSGPPGTGKTMAAQVIAATLDYDLFRVDLAGVISKWVGETSQNFERILTRAADMHAIILFDECDAIFSKRTSEVHDAQDKFANTDAAYLLQAMESYPGIAFLATNQKGNIDPAFIRRLRYLLEFSKPDAAQRLEIWRKVVRGLGGEARRDALDSSLRLLADSVEVTGAQIKFATLGAVFAARRDALPMELRHLVRGLERELAKEGRALGTRERERIMSHGK